jgi:hypothetical protein
MAADLELVGDQWGGTGDIGLDTRRRWRLFNDGPDRIDGLVGQ